MKNKYVRTLYIGTMVKHFYSVFVLLFLLMTSCNHTNQKEPNFLKEEALEQELMPLKEISSPFRVEIKHPFLILQNDEKLRNSMFHIYDLTTNELKYVFGRMGQGPKEFVLPWLMRSSLPDLMIMDNHSFYRYSIGKDGIPISKDTIKPLYTNNLGEASFINDSLFVVDAQYTGPYVHQCSIKDEMPQKSWKYRNPDIMDYFIDPNRGELYASDRRIVFCYKYKKQIDFMDIQFNLIKSVKYDYTEPTNIAEKPGEDKISYTDAYLGKRYLYAMFMGVTENEHAANLWCGAHLEVYDLDGNPVKRFVLKGKRPIYFAVDEETFTLYGVIPDGVPEDNLLVYKLKGLS